MLIQLLAVSVAATPDTVPKRSLRERVQETVGCEELCMERAVQTICPNMTL